MNRFFLTLVLFSSSVAAAQDEKVLDRTGKVYSSLADYTLNRDEVRKRFAYMATAEIQKINQHQDPEISNFVFFGAGSGSHAYKYWCVMQPWQQRQHWQEWLEAAGKISSRKVANENENSSAYIVKMKGEENWKFQHDNVNVMKFLAPFDDILHPQMLSAMYRIDNMFERWLMSNGELESSVMIGGKLVTKWKVYDKHKFKITQEEAKGFMPVEIEHEDDTLKELCRINWIKQKKLWVPTHIRASSEGKVETLAHFIKLDWKLGKDVPVEVFNAKSSEHRHELCKLFGFRIDQVIGGQFIPGTPYESPEDLFEDKQTVFQSQH